MARFINPLKHVRVASPCKADWDQMIGSDRVRFCGECSLNVYNLSAMTRDEAESLIARTEGRLCVRFYRRNDGSILTQDCPVGLRAIRRRLSNVRKAVIAASLTFLASLGLHKLLPEVLPPPPHRVMGVMAAKSYPVIVDPPVQLAEVGGTIAIKPTRPPKQKSNR